jgi:hypothetical protein
MVTFDIFNNDAFSVSQLTQTIVDIPRVPTMIGDMGLFREYGINTPTMMIERQGSKLNLVPAAPRGGVGNTLQRTNRKLIPVSTTHLPQTDTILADVVYGVRAFGSETEVQAMQGVVRQRLELMKANIDLTMEYHRIGAIKGKVMDADGVTEILDIYDLFNMTQETVFSNINAANSAADPKQNSTALKRKMRSKLGGRSFSRVRVLCSESYFDKLVGHDKMKAAWELWNQGAFARTDQSTSDFEFAGVVYTVYEGEIGGSQVIEDGFAYAMPEGVPNMFQTAFAPADYMETVNTLGVPYYAKQEALPMNKGIHMESQSNPVCLNTLPEAVFKLSVAAS